MNERIFSEIASPAIRNVIVEIMDTDIQPERYRDAMTWIGWELGQVLSNRLGTTNKQICVACTVEDADFLAQGLLNSLSEKFGEEKIRFACFWNQKSIDPHNFEELDISPIIKSYIEPTDKDCILVVVKSVISGGCVVATNITNLIDQVNPSQIFIVAPVMMSMSKAQLERRFDTDIVQRFEYVAYAIDSERDPSISVYQRYGWMNDLEKNKITPQLVKMRRRAYSSCV